MIERKRDDVLYGRLKMIQPESGPRINIDTILLSAFARIKSREKVLELGSAHGAVSMILALRFPRAAEITGIELQEELVSIGKINLVDNGLDNIVRFVRGDLKETGRIFKGQVFDVIVTNPPYFDPLTHRESVSSSRQVANHGKACSLADVLDSASLMLKNRGRLYMVMKSDRLTELLASLRERRLEPKVLRHVYPSMKKDSTVTLVYACKGAGRGVKVRPPLFIYDKNGKYTSEFLEAYTLKENPCL